MNGSVMEIHMRENTRKEKCMDKESIYGIQVNIMKDSGKGGSRTDMVSGKEFREINTLANGKVTSLTVLGSTLGVTVMFMKVSGKLAFAMVKEVISSR